MTRIAATVLGILIGSGADIQAAPDPTNKTIDEQIAFQTGVYAAVTQPATMYCGLKWSDSFRADIEYVKILDASAYNRGYAQGSAEASVSADSQERYCLLIFIHFGEEGITDRRIFSTQKPTKRDDNDQ